MAKGIDSTVDDYAEAIEYTMNIVGEDSIGICTDFTQGHGHEFFEYLTHDRATHGASRTSAKSSPLGLRTIGEFPNLTETLLKCGHSERVVGKIMGGTGSMSSRTFGGSDTPNRYIRNSLATASWPRMHSSRGP